MRVAYKYVGKTGRFVNSANYYIKLRPMTAGVEVKVYRNKFIGGHIDTVIYIHKGFSSNWKRVEL